MVSLSAPFFCKEFHKQSGTVTAHFDFITLSAFSHLLDKIFWEGKKNEDYQKFAFFLDTLSKKYRMHSAWGFFTHKLCPLLYLDHVTCAYLESTFTNIHISTKHLKINLTYLDHNISSTNKITQQRRLTSGEEMFLPTSCSSFFSVCCWVSRGCACTPTGKAKQKKNSWSIIVWLHLQSTGQERWYHKFRFTALTSYTIVAARKCCKKEEKKHKTSPYFSQQKCHQTNKSKSGTICKSFEFRYCTHLTTLHTLSNLYKQYCIFQFELYSCLMNHWACLVQYLYLFTSSLLLSW